MIRGLNVLVVKVPITTKTVNIKGVGSINAKIVSVVYRIY
jgi:hypothetical protein